ncbi:MAG: hypothetical protein ACLVBA_10435 [Alistipes finegoldii]|uniref:hypothetical protein n=3 Tax=Rikenellaceae TaxID=171550 RepID=UPI00399C7A0D
MTVSEDFTLTFKIVSEKAAQSAYIVTLKSEAQPSEKEVISKGTAVQAEGGGIYVTVENLMSSSEYVIIAAAVSADGLYTSDAKNITTSQEAKLPGTNLGGNANSYIVSEKGQYKFETTKVNGSEISDINSADWLWMTKGNNSSNPIISDVVYKSGEIGFTVSGVEGNAVIAALDTKNNIVWSWHIWITDVPQTMEYENGTVFMDRMLGATSADRGSNKENYGLFYQWGRKDPFYGGTKDEYKTGAFATANTETTINPALNMKWRYTKKGVDIETSIKEPMNYFMGDKNIDWLANEDPSLWNNIKTDYDPCPAGYRVPSATEIESIKQIEAELDENDYAKEFWYTWNNETTYYPSYGCRDEKGELVMEGGVFMWTSSQHLNQSSYSTRVVCWGFFTDINGIGGRGTGNNIRCIVDCK